MGCSHLGCFNESATAMKKKTAPSKWPGGFYGYLCESNEPVDPEVVYGVIGRLSKKTRNGSEKPAEAKGEGYLDMDEVKAAADFGNSMDDAKDLARMVQGYLTATPAEKEALEQILQHTFRFADQESLKRFTEVISRMKNDEFEPRVRRALFSGIKDSFRTGANGFNQEGVDGVVFPEELWRDPEGFEWEDPQEFRSARYGTFKDMAFRKKEE